MDTYCPIAKRVQCIQKLKEFLNQYPLDAMYDELHTAIVRDRASSIFQSYKNRGAFRANEFLSFDIKNAKENFYQPIITIKELQ